MKTAAGLPGRRFSCKTKSDDLSFVSALVTCSSNVPSLLAHQSCLSLAAALLAGTAWRPMPNWHRWPPSPCCSTARPSGSQLIAVGERGHILVSTDAGRSWQQRPTPTRATLTSVFFADAQHGWAAGHDAVILRTTDGGATWQKVHEDLESGPILDLWFRDADTGYAIGAYGLFLATVDGGTTWEAPADHRRRAESLAICTSTSCGPWPTAAW